MNSNLIKYKFKHGFKHEFEILEIAPLFEEKKEIMTVPHRALFYQILCIEKGTGTHIVDFNPIKFSDNTIIFIPYNSVNMFDKNGDYTGKSILFTNNFFCKNKDDLQFLTTSILFSDLYSTAKIQNYNNVSELNTFLNLMKKEFCREFDSSQYNVLHNLLHLFLLQAERELKMQGNKEITKSPNLDILIKFKKILEKEYNRNKVVKSYTSQLGITEKQLNKATSSILSKTPKQIIDERIILEAKRLLAHTNISVKEIAYDLGYNEPTNFIKYFKKKTNNTPAQFRKQF